MDCFYFSFCLFSFRSHPNSSYWNDFSLLFANPELHGENPWSSVDFMVSVPDNSLIIPKEVETLEQELPRLETEDMVTVSTVEDDQVASVATTSGVTEEEV